MATINLYRSAYDKAAIYKTSRGLRIEDVVAEAMANFGGVITAERETDCISVRVSEETAAAVKSAMRRFGIRKKIAAVSSAVEQLTK